MHDHDDQHDRLIPEGKQPYETPAIVSEEAFETLALQCGKADAGCAATFGKTAS
jgi:hypothetical protein